MDTQRTIGTIGKWVAIGLTAAVLAACGGDDSGTKSATAPSGTTSKSTSSSPSPDTSSSSASSSDTSGTESSSSDSGFTASSHGEAVNPVLPVVEEQEQADSATVSNSAPTISGAPMTALNAGSAYSFTPSASDADGDALSFSIQNKPSWATFSIATGKLSGTPSGADVNTYSNIVINVTDGESTTELAAFAIAVTQISNGRVTLNWVPPTQNTDGSTLTTLSGYQIVYGTSATALTQTIQVNNAGLTTYVVEDLAPGAWYFAVKAVSSSGAQSNNSGVASTTIS